MVSPVEEVLVLLDEALEHVQHQLLVVVDQHSQDTNYSKEELVP